MRAVIFENCNCGIAFYSYNCVYVLDYTFGGLSMETIDRKVRWHEYITVNIYYFALTARSQTLALIVPLLVQNFVGEETKGAALGTIRLWGLMAALLFQAFAGILSDRSTSRWGRRRPYIFIGAVTEVIIFIIIGVIAATMEGFTGYWVLFAAYILSMLASNTGHAAVQGLIPDLIPESKHGIFSGFKAFFELPAPLIFVSFVISKLVGAENFWGALLVLSAVVLITGAITMFVPEKPVKKPAEKMNWAPVVRLVIMTAIFTAVIVGAGELVQFTSKQAEPLSDILQLVIISAMGVLGMAIAVVVGVWVSVRVSIGKSAWGEKSSFTWWVVNRLAFLVGSTNLSVFAVYFLQDHFPNVDKAVIGESFGMLMLVVGLAIFISSIPAGWLSDKFGRKIVCAFSGVLALVGTIIVVVSPTMTVLYIGGVLIGIATGFFYSASWALGTTLVPQQEAGRYLGIQNLAGAGAGAVGAYIGGPIGDNVGFTVLMMIFGLLFLVSTLALLGIKKSGLSTEIQAVK
jgi:MFS family permease